MDSAAGIVSRARRSSAVKWCQQLDLSTQPQARLVGEISGEELGLRGGNCAWATGTPWTRREHWVLHDEMIIGPDDEGMQQMLLTKLAGNDPADLIQQRIEDFRLRI